MRIRWKTIPPKLHNTFGEREVVSRLERD